MEVHDLHVWSIKSGMVQCTAHVVLDVHTMKEGCDILDQASKICSSHQIDHACLQVSPTKASSSLFFFFPFSACEKNLSISMITFIPCLSKHRKTKLKFYSGAFFTDDDFRTFLSFLSQRSKTQVTVPQISATSTRFG